MIRNIYDKTKLTTIETPEGEIELSYLCGSKVGTVTKGDETISYAYDGSLPISEALTGTLDQSHAYSYDNDFRLSQMSYAGESVSYAYDGDGLLTGSGMFTITRKASNGLPEAVTGGGSSLSRTFNGYGEMDGEALSVSDLAVSSWTLIRDNAGRIISKTEVADGATSELAYTYDPLGRLLTVAKAGLLVEEYEYGPNGGRIHEKNTLRAIASRSMDYSEEDHLLTAGDVTYQYDPDGFLTTKTDGDRTTHYTYSSWGELLGVTLPDGRVIEYVHDPLGRRIAKKVNGFVTEKYLWQGMTKLLAVFDGTNTLLMRFHYADARMPLAMSKEGATYHLSYDQVGSLKLILDSSGNTIKRIDHDSFGNILLETNRSFSIPFGFAGGLSDPDTGLVHFGFRDYDPDVGRWTAKDPIRFAGGDTNLYGYVLNDPVNCVDPKGLWTIAIGGSGTAGAGLSGTFSQALVFDSHGNIGIVTTLGGGGMGGVNASGGGMVQVTNAGSIYDLRGFSTQTGGSVGELLSGGGELVIGDGYMGIDINVGIGGGLTPGELHSILGYSWVNGMNIFPHSNGFGGPCL